MQVLKTGTAVKQNMWAWMQLEKPNMTVEEARSELEAVGSKVLEIGSRYKFKMAKPIGVQPAWGKDEETAREEYLKVCYPAHYKDAKLLEIELEGRCFKVAQV